MSNSEVKRIAAQNEPRKPPRGFQTMDPERRREIASQGGKEAHRIGKAHIFNHEEAVAAGRKGGLVGKKRTTTKGGA
jgi:general stress protein YciG